MTELPYIRIGDDVLVGDFWYPVIGFSLRVAPDQPKTGKVFTSKKYGSITPLGFEIDYADIRQVRQNGDRP